MIHIKTRQSLVFLVWVGLAVGLFWLITSERSVLEAGLHVLGHARQGWVAGGLGLSLATTLPAAFSYYFLSVQKLPLASLWAVQMSGLLVDRVIPAGVGGLGLNYRFLRLHKLSASTAASVIAANNLLGVIGNCLLLVVVLPFTHGTSFGHLNGQLTATQDGLMAVVLAALGIALALVIAARLRPIWARRITLFLKPLRAYRRAPWRLAAALLMAVLITGCNALALWFSVRAVGSVISLGAALAVFSFGIVLTVATPTPGGLGGAEASLSAALIVAGLSPGQALAAALLFRIVNFWLPLLPGGLALLLARRKRYI